MMRSSASFFSLAPLRALGDMRSQPYTVVFYSARTMVPMPCRSVPSQAPFMKVHVLFQPRFFLPIKYPTDSSKSTRPVAEPLVPIQC